MATMHSNPANKQLKELLQEKQDPFVLHLYLLERGYLTNKMFSSRKSIKKSVSCLNLLGAVYSRIRIRSSSHRNGNVGENKEEAAELDRFSSDSSSTVFNSCSNGSDAEETSTSHQKDHFFFKPDTSQPFLLCNPIQNKAVSDRKLRWQCTAENRELSPISILEAAASHRASPDKNKTKGFRIRKETNSSRTNCVLLPKKVEEESILSASLWKVLFQSAKEKSKTDNNNNISSQFLKSNKSVLPQTRQLLFDCVREIVANQERKQKQQQQQQQQRDYLASEDLGKLSTTRDKNKWWGSKSLRENESKLLKSDSVQEWSGFESQRSKIGFEIEDAIFEEMRNELVMDMIHL
ncbi:uncharacterized protein LOC126666339 [Mercurialis annua]|uniref:uncharacterized protein LOC126666339 n=1 Tax=Mercurialis annua TaxID=3986 RepID=UPI00215F225F|nr:uncharacterized protein LOC126666339 [Mercurialis annua]